MSRKSVLCRVNDREERKYITKERKLSIVDSFLGAQPGSSVMGTSTEAITWMVAYCVAATALPTLASTQIKLEDVRPS